MNILVVISVAVLTDLSRAEVATKIIGGDVARSAYPFMVSIQISMTTDFLGFKNTKKYHSCGGSIISTNYILTAGKQVGVWK